MGTDYAVVGVSCRILFSACRDHIAENSCSVWRFESHLIGNDGAGPLGGRVVTKAVLVQQGVEHHPALETPETGTRRFGSSDPLLYLKGNQKENSNFRGPLFLKNRRRGFPWFVWAVAGTAGVCYAHVRPI